MFTDTAQQYPFEPRLSPSQHFQMSYLNVSFYQQAPYCHEVVRYIHRQMSCCKPVFNYNELPIVFESTSVFRALQYVPCFVALICDGVGRPDVISASACLARVSTVLRAVHFRSCSAKEGLSDLAESLAASPQSPLDHIDVAGNHFKENEVEALLSAYETRVTPLNLLNLSNCELTQETSAVVLEQMGEHRSLHNLAFLGLAGAEWSERCEIAFVAFLRSTGSDCRLRVLDLTGVKWGLSGMISALAEAHAPLEALRLNGCDLSQAVSALVHLCEISPTLGELEIAYSGISPRDACAVVRALGDRVVPVPLALDLGGLGLRKAALYDVVKALLHTRLGEWRRLSWADNGLQEADLELLAGLAFQMPNLEEVDLSGNFTTEKEATGSIGRLLCDFLRATRLRKISVRRVHPAVVKPLLFACCFSYVVRATLGGVCVERDAELEQQVAASCEGMRGFIARRGADNGQRFLEHVIPNSIEDRLRPLLIDRQVQAQQEMPEYSSLLRDLAKRIDKPDPKELEHAARKSANAATEGRLGFLCMNLLAKGELTTIDKAAVRACRGLARLEELDVSGSPVAADYSLLELVVRCDRELLGLDWDDCPQTTRVGTVAEWVGLAEAGFLRTNCLPHRCMRQLVGGAQARVHRKGLYAEMLQLEARMLRAVDSNRAKTGLALRMPLEMTPEITRAMKDAVRTWHDGLPPDRHWVHSGVCEDLRIPLPYQREDRLWTGLPETFIRERPPDLEPFLPTLPGLEKRFEQLRGGDGDARDGDDDIPEQWAALGGTFDEVPGEVLELVELITEEEEVFEQPADVARVPITARLPFWFEEPGPLPEWGPEPAGATSRSQPGRLHATAPPPDFVFDSESPPQPPAELELEMPSGPEAEGDVPQWNVSADELKFVRGRFQVDFDATDMKSLFRARTRVKGP